LRENKIIVSTYLERSLYSCLQRVAEALGVSVSEYIRRLVINDLEKRSALLSTLYEFEKLGRDA